MLLIHKIRVCGENNKTNYEIDKISLFRTWSSKSRLFWHFGPDPDHVWNSGPFLITLQIIQPPNKFITRLTTASRALQHPLQPIFWDYNNSSFPHNLFTTTSWQTGLFSVHPTWCSRIAFKVSGITLLMPFSSFPVFLFLHEQSQATHCFIWAAQRLLYCRRLLPVTGRSQLAGGESIEGFWPEACFLLPSLPVYTCVLYTLCVV